MLRSLPLCRWLSCSAGVRGAPLPGAQELSLSFLIATTPARASAVGVNGLEIRKDQLVVAEVALEFQNEIEGSNDDAALYEEFTSGPTLIKLPVNGGLVRSFATAIPNGVDDELEVAVESPDDGDADHAAFRAAHPTWPSDASARVVGVHSGESFDVDAELEMEFPSMVIDAGSGPLNVTVAVDVGGGSGPRMDPRSIRAERTIVSAGR